MGGIRSIQARWRGQLVTLSHIELVSCSLVNDKVWASTHYACPFGAVASVHAWERVGELLAMLARRLFLFTFFAFTLARYIHVGCYTWQCIAMLMIISRQRDPTP